MTIRVQVVLDEEERERFRELASREGRSLSAWFRDAARDRADLLERKRVIETVEDLHAFFEQCDSREGGREPDWSEHLEIIDASRKDGLPDA